MKNCPILIIMVALLLMAPYADSQAAVMTVGSGSGNANETLEIDITVDDPELIAGAAFTLIYSSSLSVNVRSEFFDTFINQFDPLPTTGPAEEDNGVTKFPLLDGNGDPVLDGNNDQVYIEIPAVVDSVPYYQPLIVNDPEDNGTVYCKISAARCSPATAGEDPVLFTLDVSLKNGEPAGTYPLTIVPTELNNEDAGYDPNGETIDLLVGSDLNETIESGNAFPVMLAAADYLTDVVNGQAKFFTDSDNDGMDDEWEDDNFQTLDHDGTGDTDHDGYSDKVEHDNDMNPNVQDAAGGIGYSACTDNRVETQQVTLQPQVDYVFASANFLVDINYDVSDGDNMLDGIDIAVHFDSSKVDYTGVNNYDGIIDDAGDDDNNPDTDKMLLMSWTGNNDWPNDVLPAALASLEFTTKNDVNPEDEIPFNVTCSQTSTGYSFCGYDSEVTVSNWTTDADGDGVNNAMTDGLLIVRYMGYYYLIGDAWIDDAASPGCPRTASEIADYMSTNYDLLDVDGDGVVNAMTDGLLIVRYMGYYYLIGDAWIDDAASPDATRTASEIADYIQALMP